MRLPITDEGRLVAEISATDGDLSLVYSDAWLTAPDAFPISLTMPIADAIYPAAAVLPWLANLLPEGEPLRAMTRRLGAAPEDVLTLIAETGADLAGALRMTPPARADEAGYRLIGDAEALERIIAELPARPFLVGESGVSMSLAGAQDKLPVALREEGLAVPINGAPSTHILKPDNPRLIGSVQNEALCMVLARRIGLETAAVTTGSAGARDYLLVTRYDRRIEAAGTRRIHQEDFCQALGRPPAAKYEFNQSGSRGPSLPEMFGVASDHMTARDTTRLLDAVIFNIAIGNVDSHAKNYSILLQPGGATLAPLYDLMTGLAWGGITENHPQAIGGQQRGRHIHARHWRRMAEACGLAGSGTLRRVAEVTARMALELPAARDEVAAMPAGPGAMLGIVARSIDARIAEVAAHAREDGPPDEDVAGNARAGR